jgi:hypothetical protein
LSDLEYRRTATNMAGLGDSVGRKWSVESRKGAVA